MTELNADQRPKRLLSPESVSLPASTKLDKRQRHNSLLIFQDLPQKQETMDDNELPEQDLKTWMSQISQQLKLAASKSDIDGLATKSDFDKMNDRLVAQGVEIKQIRDMIDQYKKDFDALRISFDQTEARRLNQTYETNYRNGGNYNVNNMAAPTRPRFQKQTTTRRNLVIEGLKGKDEGEMIANLIQLTTAIGAVIYKTDVESIFRLPRRDTLNKTPGPVLVCFNRISICDNILKRKINLRDVQGMQEVYVNPDEPIEVRRAKAECRRIAVIARRDGEEVELRHDYIKIGETVFSLDELQKIPEKYRPDSNQDKGLDQACGGEAPDMETETNSGGEKT